MIMKMYHGTTAEAAEAIESEGFYGSDVSEFTSGNAADRDGVVYFTDSIEEAKGYGDVVIEVELLNAEPVFFQESPVSDAKEYYVSCATLREDGVWKVLQA